MSQSNHLLKTDHQKRIEQFMSLASQEIPGRPVVPPEDVRLLRAKLIFEEAMETLLALGVDVMVPPLYGQSGPVPLRLELCEFQTNNHRGCDIVGVVDGCADISVVTIGTLSAFGVSDGPVLTAVDLSNLAKFGEGGHRREDGKWVKPANWIPPNLLALLREQGYVE